uniref:Uncharacterized protein n=1 Tax=Romanomermis culicivorax TaxID=13658 RepID=A0A915L1U2_ROMCU
MARDHVINSFLDFSHVISSRILVILETDHDLTTPKNAPLRRPGHIQGDGRLDLIAESHVAEKSQREENGRH